jgi:3-methyladenine DNA glycosylase AlkC
MDKKFSLKDHLFNEQKIEKIAKEIGRVYPEFEKVKFKKSTLIKFPQLELKERIAWITENLKNYLPPDFRAATKILLESLPAPNDNSKSDNDFGDFIYAPYADFVAKHGCKTEHLQFALDALKEITTRFSAEDAIRYFINAFPDKTMNELQKWSLDSHYHVRRLASEGTRPKLPWSQKITIPIERPLTILNNLFADKTRFVTRSVANHLNDISKSNPELAIETLDKWQKSNQQDPKEMEYIINHSLRTLVKKGEKKAIEFLNFSSKPKVTISAFKINKNPIAIGEAVEFEFALTPKKDERLIIDYVLYFSNKEGKTNNKKVFKIKQIEVKRNQKVVISKKHRLIGDMTTRKIHPGKHVIEIQVNGQKMAKKDFELVPPVSGKRNLKKNYNQ